MSRSDFERKILRDNKSGSSEILNLVLKYNLQYLKENNLNSDALRHLLTFNIAVETKFSAMAIVGNGLNKANKIISESIDDKKSAKIIAAKLEKLIKEIAKIDREIITNCSILFPITSDKIALATYSNSGLVKKVVKSYRKKISKIYMSEARPANEGKEMAQYFAEIGIEVVFTVDALLPGLLSKADLLILGADSVGQDMFINKIGTGVLLESAGRSGVKSAVLFESLKIKKSGLNASLKNDYNSREIWPTGRPGNITVINQYFEVINNSLADRFISDLGVETSQSLKKRIINDQY